MPRFLEPWLEALAGWPPGLAPLAAALAALLGALLLHRLAMALLGQIARRTRWIVDDAFERRCARPLQVLVLLLAARALGGALLEGVPALAAGAAKVALIATVGWLLARLVRVFEDSVLAQLDLDAPDNLRARRVHTQIRFLRRLVAVAIVVLTGGAVLLSFDSLRDVGAGLLTSAGIAGVVIGLAAQRTMGNLIAGFQIVFTQPIRTDDVVIVEGEWGRIEEITLTYVVVRIWDQRRLVVPIGWFLEHPFQNWTRVSADLLATVYLQVDYTVDVDELRGALERTLERSPHWDGKVWRIHVTEARERTLELRALMSAPDSGAAWELRCEVREALVRHLRERHPEALPRLRAEVGTLAREIAEPARG